ncbi:NAD-dependent DNA ligase LigA [Leptospira sp. GIMC2001]|uniref:NAD-dependent DNA ligase LigA n=1 Tax=Leptospira sp. GIMC2001 TaxID=1513297 RepID=UPI0004A5C545|nr:NAD-dependent DNA ligase LigA [Leptospira sp. GIMC2001]AID56277.1 DNA ligase [Leptospira sp. GIMC2001]WCL49590.1 NAD-dependent DNA ligase LigA [Leptospira sp. GIMC2001]
MKLEKVSLEMRDLETAIRKHQYFYYLENSPKIKDKEFDILFQKLKKLEEKYPDLISESSPTKLVGSDLSSSGDFAKFKHKIPVLSLENTYNLDELMEWVNKTGLDENYSVEWKIDGASIVLYYNQGILTNAVTRGSGGVGDDVTDNIKTIESIPHKLSSKINLYVRGEVFMNFSDFDDFNEEYGGRFANPRNLTAGSIKHKYASEVAKRPLRLFVYDAFFPDGRGKIVTNSLALQKLKDFKLPLAPDSIIVSGSKLSKTVESFRKKKDSMGFPIDGLVIKLDDLRKRDALGETSHSPRWARAYKFDALIQETTIEEIIPQVGRTGKITPRARVKPVKLAGTTVTYATLHNQDYINELGVGIGAKVRISKRGEIIPAVEEVVEPGLQGIFQLPKKCPSCKSILSKVDESVDLFCTNKNCPERERHSILFFCQKKQMDIDGLGVKQIDLFYDKGWVRNIGDLYDLHTKKDQIETLEGFGAKSVKIILEGIEKSKNKDLRILLPSIGLHELGHKVVEILIENGYTSIESLLDLVKKPDAAEELNSIHGIGPRTAQAIVTQLNDKTIQKLINKLMNSGLNFRAAESEKSDHRPFEGQAWCVTGSFDRFQPRDTAMDLIVKHGGRKVTSVSSKTTHLLYGEGAGSKLDKAKELGLQIINESEFLNILSKENILID